MNLMQKTTPGKNAARERVLKFNRYKRVVLAHDGKGRPFVVKTFSGHDIEDCRRNALHTYRSLQLLRSDFGNVLRSPAPLDLDLDKCSVRMDYLPDLPAARQLCLADIPRLSAFFIKCYELGQGIEYLGSIRNSVHLTDKARGLIDSGFPMRLGFKGDLYENLRISDSRLLLADTEAASVEPLGMSELVLHIFLASSLRSLAWVGRGARKYERPIAFDYLSQQQSTDLIEAAMQYARIGMQKVPAPLRAAKRIIARTFLYKTLGTN